jgi:hypothetical protein
MIRKHMTYENTYRDDNCSSSFSAMKKAINLENPVVIIFLLINWYVSLRHGLYED